MRCWFARWQISNALDRGDLAAYRTRGHAAHCPACQAFADSLVALDRRLARDAHLAVAPAAAAPRRWRWPLWLGPPLVAAAVAVIVIRVGQPELHAVDPDPAIQVPDALGRARSLAGQVSQALARTPLETELDALIHDGKRGLAAVLDTSGLR